MRNLVLGLLLLNLAFFAYAEWIDQPEASAPDPHAALPRLLLASEFPHTEGTPGDAAAAEISDPQKGTQGASDQGGSCVAVGPFFDAAGVGKAAAMYKDRGVQSRERSEPGEVSEGFWVHIENIATAADQARVMRSLQQAGLSDASPVQSPDETRHISVGIFSEQQRAERRASAVKRLGIDAEVSPRKHAGTVYWLELQAKPDAVSTEGIPPPNGGMLETRACSSGAAAAPSTVRR